MRTILSIALACIYLMANAEVFTIDGITYTTTKDYKCYVSGHTNDHSEDIVVPSAVTSDGIEYTVTDIGTSAFSGIDNVRTMTLPNTINSIGQSGFSGAKIPSLKLPEGLTSIGQSAFSGCQMEAIELPSTLTYIGYYAFQSAKRLKSIDIPGSVTIIRSQAFSGCSALESVVLNDGTTVLYEECFKNCGSLKSIRMPSTMQAIDNNCFYGCGALAEITIPEGITKLNSGCFQYCGSLVSVKLPSTLKEMYYSFKYCSALEKIEIPEGVTIIGNGTFQHCTSLKTINLPSGITFISGECFDGCSSLEDITIPEGVTKLDTYAFRGCASLKQINIPTGVADINSRCFDGCANLKTVSLPPTIKLIPTYCFNNCANLTEIEIPKTVTDIKSSAFEGCASLGSISLPDGLQTIEQYCFKNCLALTTVTIPKDVTSIGNGAFEGCTSLVSVALPSGLTQLEAHCFKNCVKLSHIEIPDETKKIRPDAFRGCSALHSVVIGRGVQDIETSAFRDCGQLQKITCRNLLPPSIDNQFSQTVYDSAVLEIDNSSEHIYREHAVWSKFTNVTPVDFGYTSTFDLSEWETIRKLHSHLKENGWTGVWHIEVGPNIATQLPGITVENDHVASISLPNSKVNSNAFTSILKFPMTRSIDISNNNIAGDIASLIPAEVVNTNLTELNISGNQMTGNLARVNDRFPSLTSLKAQNNRFASVAPYLNVKTININNQSVPDTIRWTLGALASESVRTDIPDILIYNHSGKSFESRPSFRIKDNSNKIYLRGTESEGLYTIKADSKNSNYIFKIGEEYDLYLEIINRSSGRVPVAFDFIEGDCNCDAAADITDLQNLINYILGVDQAQKVFNEQVVNFDGNDKLNVIDVVGMVDFLLNQDRSAPRAIAIATTGIEHDAELSIHNGNLTLDSRKPVSALGFTLLSTDYFSLSPALTNAGFVCAQKHRGNSLRIIIYSPTGAAMPEGLTELGTSGAFAVTDCEASSPANEYISIIAGSETSASPVIGAGCIIISIGHIKVSAPAHFNGGRWTAYDISGRLLSCGEIRGEETSIAVGNAATCVLVISKEGEEPYVKKINL